MTHPTQNLRQRGLVLLMVAGLLLATAGVAVAKPDKPAKPEHATYQVTMRFIAGADGLATSCPGFSPTVTMTGSGNMVDGRRQNLETNIHYGTSGEALTGCHGNALDASGTYAMWITPVPKRQQVRVLWRFDPAFDANGNPQEFFELRSVGSGLLGGTLAWRNGVVDGQFSLRRWNAGASWTELGEVHLTFDLTIEKIQPQP